MDTATQYTSPITSDAEVLGGGKLQTRVGLSFVGLCHNSRAAAAYILYIVATFLYPPVNV